MGSYKRSAERAEMEVSNTRFLLTKRRKSTRALQELELTSPDIELEEPRFISNSLNEAITLASSSSSSGVVLAAGGGGRCFRLCSGVSSFPRCSSNESCGIVKDSFRFVDLEAKSLETEISRIININKFMLIFTNSFINDSSFFICFDLYPSKIQEKPNRFLSTRRFIPSILIYFHPSYFSRETTPLSSELSGDSEEMESPEKNPPSSPAKQKPKTPSHTEIDEFFSVNEKYEQKRFAEKYNYDIVKDMPVGGRYQWVRLKP